MNKVAAANAAAFALLQTVAAAHGVANVARNTLEMLDPDDGGDARREPEDQPARLLIAFMDDRAPRISGESLGPPSFDLVASPKVIVVALGDEAVGREARDAFFDALAEAVIADRTLGGACGWAESGFDPEADDDDEMGAEARADTVSIVMDIADCATARG